MESKVGRTSLSSRIDLQIQKDFELLNTPGSGVNAVEWHFFPGSTGVGPTAPLMQQLENCGITVWNAYEARENNRFRILDRTFGARGRWYCTRSSIKGSRPRVIRSHGVVRLYLFVHFNGALWRTCILSFTKNKLGEMVVGAYNGPCARLSNGSYLSAT